jgi:hypothetical protein
LDFLRKSAGTWIGWKIKEMVALNREQLHGQVWTTNLKNAHVAVMSQALSQRISSLKRLQLGEK